MKYIDAMADEGALTEYHLYHAVRADLCRRLKRFEDARLAYQRALALTQQEPEQRYLQERLEEISKFCDRPVDSSTCCSTTL